MKIKFADGVEFDTGGEYRIEERTDGFYIVGQGGLIPVKDRAEGEELIKCLKRLP
jgi:hypothetical protein